MPVLPTAQIYDVIIAGGGPAGSSSAIRLSLAGLNVLLIEKADFPRHKLCGEFISPECLPYFAELGVLPDLYLAGAMRVERTAFYGRHGAKVEIPSDWLGNHGRAAIGLSRAAMDAALLDRAVAVGTRVMTETTVKRVHREQGGVAGVQFRDKSGTENEARANILLDATGRSRSLAQQVVQATPGKTPAKSVAFKAHLRGCRVAPGDCEIYAYRGGYGGCTSIEGDLANLCFIVPSADVKRLGSDPNRVMHEIVCTNRRAATALVDAEMTGQWYAVPVARYGRFDLSPVTGLLAVGDSAGFIDPFTGSGMLMALESAKIVSDVICNARDLGLDRSILAKDYAVRYSAKFDKRFRMSRILRVTTSVPYLDEMLISVLSKSEAASRTLAMLTRINAGQDV